MNLQQNNKEMVVVIVLKKPVPQQQKPNGANGTTGVEIATLIDKIGMMLPGFAARQTKLKVLQKELCRTRQR